MCLFVCSGGRGSRTFGIYSVVSHWKKNSHHLGMCTWCLRSRETHTLSLTAQIYIHMYTSAFICMALAKEKRTRESGGTAPDLFFSSSKDRGNVCCKRWCCFRRFRWIKWSIQRPAAILLILVYERGMSNKSGGTKRKQNENKRWTGRNGWRGPDCLLFSAFQFVQSLF